MLTVTATFDLIILYFVAANVIALLAYVLVLKYRVRAKTRDIGAITKAIVDYFRENGAEVGVECINRAGSRRFVALISSKPLKRFRHSSIVELVVAAHVRKVCGLELEKVYWCFPIERHDQAQSESAASNAPAMAKGDDYFAEGPSSLAKVPSYRVNELSLDRYEALVQKQDSKPKAELDFASGN
ncbi:MAG: hypothetical protein ABI724_09165 [Betaproteobacteria bacterium]